jgi:hypothetical protein
LQTLYQTGQKLQQYTDNFSPVEEVLVKFTSLEQPSAFISCLGSSGCPLNGLTSRTEAALGCGIVTDGETHLTFSSQTLELSRVLAGTVDKSTAFAYVVFLQ